MAGPWFVVLVSGNPAEGDDGFARCAWLRVAELVNVFFKAAKKTAPPIRPTDVLRFIHFDCHDTSVKIYEHDFAKQGGRVRDPTARTVKRNWTTLDADFVSAHPALPTAQDPKTFVQWKSVSEAKAAGAFFPVSMVDAYHTVRNAPPGSVLEVSVFSHAFVDGPVLFEDSKAIAGSTRRTPGDSDGRAAVDFQADMGEDGAANTHALQEFRAGFAPTGSFRIWGCNIQDIVDTIPPGGGTKKKRCLIMNTVREVTEAGYTIQFRRGTAASSLLRRKSPLAPGSTMVSLDMGREIAHELEVEADPVTAGAYTTFSRDRLFEIRYDENPPGHTPSYHGFFRGERTTADPAAFATTLSRSLSDIVKFVAQETIPSYVFAAAQALGTVTVVGGAPGTSADIDDVRGQFIDAGRLDQARFFSQFFGISMTEPDATLQRHYAFFDNQGKAVASVLDRAAHGLP